jgi:hypothetical protein
MAGRGAVERGPLGDWPGGLSVDPDFMVKLGGRSKPHPHRPGEPPPEDVVGPEKDLILRTARGPFY